MNLNFARRVSRMKGSEVRRMLKVAENNDILSFAGGLPAAELFPIEDIMKANAETLKNAGPAALQYSSSEGYEPLRQWIAERMNRTQATALNSEEVIITSGSQQALDLTGKLFLDEGDVVLCECPTYLTAISAFGAYECDFVEVPTDDQGMLIEDLENILENNNRVKVIYVIPNFQNPSGRTWSVERRQKLAALAEKHEVIVVEDNPYGELRFEGEHLPSVKSFDKAGYVLYFGTFSKIYCPGYRIAWVAGNKEVLEKYVVAKQAADLQSNTLAQREIYQYITMFDIDEHIRKMVEVYKKRKDVAVRTVDQYFPTGSSYADPEGGLFLWVTLPEVCDTTAILPECLRRGVTMVPGTSFYPGGGHKNTMRLNYSCLPEEKIEYGLRLIGEVICSSMEGGNSTR